MRDLFGPPLAIEAAPSSAEPSDPVTPPPVVATAAVPTPVPLRLHRFGELPRRPFGPVGELPSRPSGAVPMAVGVELRTGYGLGATTASAAASGTELAPRELRTTRLDRQVRIRSRRWGDDEFRRAGRAELFSDDARYSVLFTLTAGWFGPVTAIYLIWVLLVSDEADASGVFAGLGWLMVAAALSVVVVGLLRWASVGWRAISLSVAAALIGGGVTAIAHTLTG